MITCMISVLLISIEVTQPPLVTQPRNVVPLKGNASAQAAILDFLVWFDKILYNPFYRLLNILYG